MWNTKRRGVAREGHLHLASGFASQEANRNIGDLKPTLGIVFPDPDQLLSALRRFLSVPVLGEISNATGRSRAANSAESGFGLPGRFGCARPGNVTIIESATTVAMPVILVVITRVPSPRLRTSVKSAGLAVATGALLGCVWNGPLSPIRGKAIQSFGACPVVVPASADLPCSVRAGLLGGAAPSLAGALHPY